MPFPLRTQTHHRTKDDEVDWLSQQQQLLQLTHDIIIILAIDGAITFWNKAAEDNYGWSREEALGKNCHELLKTKSEVPIPEIKRLLLDQCVWEGELTHTCRDGARLLVLSRWVMGREKENAGTIIFELNANITEEKRLADELLESEERFRQMFEQTNQQRGTRLERARPAPGKRLPAMTNSGKEQSGERTCEELVSRLLSEFTALPPEQVVRHIDEALSRVAVFFGFDRLTLWEFSEAQTETRLVHAWGEGDNSGAPRFMKDFPWWSRQMLRGEITTVSNLDDLPAEAAAEKEAMRQRGVVSAATVPMIVGGQVTGCMAFVCRKGPVNWTKNLIRELEVVTQIFATALKRQRATEALTESEASRISILSAFRSHVAVLDREGTITEVNDVWSRFWRDNGGTSDVPGPGVNYIRICRQTARSSDAAAAAAGIQAVLDRRLPRFQQEYECHSPTEQRWFLMSVTPLNTTNGGAVVKHEEITALRKAEVVGREREERFRSLADTAPIMIWMTGLDQGASYFNARYLEFTGRDPGSQVGWGWTDVIHPDDLRKVLDTYAHAFKHHRPFSTECRVRRADGVYRWILNTAVPRVEPGSGFAGYIASAVDITGTKQAEEAMASFSRSLIEAQEQERTRIARELHDDIVQRLALLASGLERIKKNHAREARSRAAELSTMATDIAFDVQALSHHLHPPKLEYLGLATALKSICREVAEQQHVDIAFTSRDVPSSVSRDVSLGLFRILQEALRNGVQHGHAQRFSVRLVGTPSAIKLNVHDNGKGFQVQAAQTSKGLGLASMRERSIAMHGTFSIKSKPGHGTDITVRVPLQQEEKTRLAA